MTTQQNNNARTIPSLYDLKGEAAALRAKSAKKMSSTAALKAVARKYKFRTWEALEGFARKSITASPDVPTVTLLVINGSDQVLVVNREIIATSEGSYGDASIAGLAERLALSLRVELNEINYQLCEEIDGEDWDFSGIASKLGLINEVSFGHTNPDDSIGNPSVSVVDEARADSLRDELNVLQAEVDELSSDRDSREYKRAIKALEAWNEEFAEELRMLEMSSGGESKS